MHLLLLSLCSLRSVKYNLTDLDPCNFTLLNGQRCSFVRVIIVEGLIFISKVDLYEATVDFEDSLGLAHYGHWSFDLQGIKHVGLGLKVDDGVGLSVCDGFNKPVAVLSFDTLVGNLGLDLLLVCHATFIILEVGKLSRIHPRLQTVIKPAVIITKPCVNIGT